MGTITANPSASFTSTQAPEQGARSALGFAVTRLVWSLAGSGSGLPQINECEQRVEEETRKLIRAEMIRCNVLADRSSDV